MLKTTVLGLGAAAALSLAAAVTRRPSPITAGAPRTQRLKGCPGCILHRPLHHRASSVQGTRQAHDRTPITISDPRPTTKG